MGGEHEITAWEDTALTSQATPMSFKSTIAAALVLMMISTTTGSYLSPPTLTKLPTEIITSIMKALNTPTDLMSFILTAPRFNEIWKLNTHTVSTAVLKTSLDCFSDAKKLEEAIYPEKPVGFAAAVARHTRMIKAAKYISHMYALFKSNYLTARYSEKNQDRIWFQTSFYFLWYNVVTASYKPFRFLHQFHFDDPFPLPEEDNMLTLCELIVWIRHIRDRAVASDRIFRHAGRIYRRRPCDNNNNNDDNNNTIITNGDNDNDNDSRDDASSTTTTTKKRLSQSKRWAICCAAIWYHPWFEEVRKDYWVHDLRLHTLEPVGWYPGDPYFHARPRLLGFLAWAREVRVWRLEVEMALLREKGG